MDAVGGPLAILFAATYVSQTVRDLVTDSGTQVLKVVPGEWRSYEVASAP